MLLPLSTASTLPAARVVCSDIHPTNMCVNTAISTHILEDAVDLSGALPRSYLSDSKAVFYPGKIRSLPLTAWSMVQSTMLQTYMTRKIGSWPDITSFSNKLMWCHVVDYQEMSITTLYFTLGVGFEWGQDPKHRCWSASWTVHFQTALHPRHNTLCEEFGLSRPFWILPCSQANFHNGLSQSIAHTFIVSYLFCFFVCVFLITIRGVSLKGVSSCTKHIYILTIALSVSH